MNEDDIKTNWSYFCSLASQFNNTVQYVDHRLNENGEMINGTVFSNEFAKILMLSSSEFEVIARALCTISEIKLPWNANIIKITEAVTGIYPRIRETKISTPYQTVCPLENWKVEFIKKNNGNSKELIGLDWWDSYNKIKHTRNKNYTKATLENCLLSLASLMVLELYLCKKVLGNFDVISNIDCDYFGCDYWCRYVVVRSKDQLPDYGEKQ